MKTNLNRKFKRSKSYNKLKPITEEIPTFHHHYHILHDLRNQLGYFKVYMEIGSYCGASASLMLQHPDRTHVICIDPLNLPKNRFNGTKDQYNTLKDNLDKYKEGTKSEYTIYKNFSNDKELLQKLKDNNTKVDLLFIDGDHRYNGVINDFWNYHEFVNPGGFIVFDDYLDHKYCPQVKRAVDDIVKTIQEKNLPYEIIGSLPNYQNAKMEPQQENLNEFILYKTK